MIPDQYQQKAINQINTNAYVCASAGTGKTAVLTNRFIKILKEKQIELSSIIAITFTEKAASEMKKRIFSLINKELLATKTNTEKHHYWKKIKKEFTYANISTIHSLSSSIIREHAYELNIDPDFDIIEENYIKYELQKWIKKQLLKWKNENTQKTILNTLLKEYTIKELINILNKLFMNYQHTNSFILPLYEEKLNDSKKYYDFLKSSLETERKDSFNNFISSKKNIEYTLWNKQKEILQDYGIKPKTYKKIENIDKVISSLYKEDLHYENISYPLVKPIYAKLSAPSKSKIENQDIEQQDIEEIYEKLSDFLVILKWVLPEYAFDIDNIDLEEVSKTYNIIRNIIELYKNIFDSIIQSPSIVPALYKWLSAYLLTFDDLQSYALKLLTHNSHAVEELKSKIKYIMVDEVQDIDETQKAIITALASDKVNIFIVGDEKQSIYKFRGANLSAFKELGKTIGKPINLEISYRSNKEIIAFANLIFANLMEYAYESFEASYEELKPKDNNSETKTKVELLIQNNKNEEIEALSIANRIFDLIENDKKQYKDIAILLRSFTNINIYETALRKKGIPHFTVKTKGFYNNNEIIDCINLLKCINNSFDEIVLCAVLRSPFCGISDETLFWLTSIEENKEDKQNKKQSLVKGFYNFHKDTRIPKEEHNKLNAFSNLLNNLKDKKDRIGIDKLLKVAIDESLYIPATISKTNGEEIKQNLQRFIRKIQNIQITQNTYSLTETIDFIENVERDSDISDDMEILTDENKVIIMTVHKAKGMEFPVVIIPNSDMGRSHIEQITIDNEYGLAIKTVGDKPDSNYKLNDSFLTKYLKHKDKRKDIAENKRLFYVAVTRAEEHLIISGTASLIPKHPFELVGSGVWMDYILWVLFKHSDGLKHWLTENISSEKPLRKTFSIANTKIAVLYGYTKLEKVIKESKNTSTMQTPNIKIDKSLSILPDKVSASSLLVYKKCLRKFYYKFILQIEESQEELGPYKNKDINDDILNDLNKNEETLSKDIPLNLIGSLVHKILEGYKQNKSIVELVLIYLKLERLSILADEDHIEQINNKIRTILTTFVNSKLYKTIEWSSKHAGEQDYNELSFSCSINNVLLEGSIDKIYKDENGEICILDYKTNRFKKKANITKQIKEKNALYKMQMEIYWLITQLLFPNETTSFKSSLYYFDIDKIEDIVKETPSFQDNIKKDILSIIKQIETDLSSLDYPLDTFHTKNAQKQDCLFCGYFMCENKEE